MPIHECVSFMLIKEEKILLERRSPYKETDPGLIAIPGGHMETGESQEQALEREMEEELAVAPETCAYLCSRYHPTSELQLIHYYVVSAWQGAISSMEAIEVFWSRVIAAPLDLRADKLALSAYIRRVEVGMTFS